MSRLDKIRAGVSRVAGRVAERLAERQEAAEAREKELLLGDGHGPAGEDVGGPERVPPPPSHPPAVAPRPRPADAVPWGLRVAAEVGWRLLVLAGVVYVLMRVIGSISLLVVVFAAGLLITALLQPTVARLRRIGLGRGFATFVTFIAGFVAMGLIGWFVVWQVIENVDTLTERVQQGIQDLRDWAIDGPFHVSEQQINDVTDNLNQWIGDNSEQLTSAGLETVTYLVEFLTGAVLTAFTTLFLLYDGRRIWEWALKFVPASAREGVAGAGPRAWMTLTGYVRGTVIVALIDAVGIGTGLYFLEVPLAVPLAVIVFLFSFIPIVGATVSGTLAVLVAFVTNGMFTALMVIILVVVVQQVEGHVLQPFILGRMVRVHPLAVVLAVSGGSLLAGIPGAVVAVPTVAVGNTVISYLRSYYEESALRASGTVTRDGPSASGGASAPGGSAPTKELPGASTEGPAQDG